MNSGFFVVLLEGAEKRQHEACRFETLTLADFLEPWLEPSAIFQGSDV